MKTVPFIILLLVTLIYTGCASRKARVDKSTSSIEELKENVLLVRVKTGENKIQTLEATGRADEARAERFRLKYEKEETIKSFNQHFDFCKVYFFDSDKGGAIKAGNIEAAELYDGQMNPVDLGEQKFLVAEFGYVYEDQLIYENEEGERASVAGTNALPALVIMDQDFIQLENPFPHRVMQTVANTSKADAVAKLNQNFHDYHFRALRKKQKRAWKATSVGG